MRLESFRIFHCFGFLDSGEIDLSESDNLVYFLGRNSSGKTSVLRAISYSEHGKIPGQHPNFANYEPSEEIPYIRGRYSVDPSGGERLSADPLIDDVIKRFSGTQVRIKRHNEEFAVTSSVSDPMAQSVAALLSHVYEVYSDLAERIRAGSEVEIFKLGDGQYRFYAEGDSYAEHFKTRMDRINARISHTRNQFGNHGLKYPQGLNFNFIEGLLFMQFPDIFTFTDRFSLDEDLPRSLREEHLQGGQNALTAAFIDLLGRDKVSALLRASSRGRIHSLREELQGRLNALSASITEDALRDAVDADFLQIFVDRADDVRIILTVDGKESYYEHLSDNTKFLVAYHVFQEDRRRKNEPPSVLLFDEPNKGFHPSAETKIPQFLESLAADGNRVLVTTHSQHMIDLDRLSAVRIMARAEDGTLHVSNKLYGASGLSQDTLALQPITDAIGLNYADQVVVRDRVVIVEGYTDMLYLRLFA